MESGAVDGDSPVSESGSRPSGILSSAEPVKLRVNLRGPPCKAEYSRMTDSEPVG